MPIDQAAPPADAGIGDAEQFARLLAVLPARQREVLTLRYMLDLPMDEIAETLGISQNSAQTHLGRAHSRVMGWYGVNETRLLEVLDVLR
jgi:DNA-directed RNA polymerase specialized sigma24 family protein